MPAPRVLVTTTDASLLGAATSAFAEVGCEVLTADGGVDCVEKARASVPDLLVLLPPLLWGSVVGVLAVLHDDPITRGVPVLILTPPAGGEPPVRIPRLLQPHASEGVHTLLGVIERVSARLRDCPPVTPTVAGPTLTARVGTNRVRVSDYLWVVARRGSTKTDCDSEARAFAPPLCEMRSREKVTC